MTTNTDIGIKSRRAHSTCLDKPNLSEYFDPVDFYTKFEKINPTVRTWDSERGEYQ